jgi:PKD repeat protein
VVLAAAAAVLAASLVAAGGPASVAWAGPSATGPRPTKPPWVPARARLSVGPARGTAPLDVTADASGSTGAAPLSYQFAFGDGSPAVRGSAATVTHQYSRAGIFLVTLTVRGANGAADTARQAVKVSPAVVPGPVRNLRVQVGADEPGNLVPCYLHYYVSWDPPARGAGQVTSYSLTPEIEGYPLETTNTYFTYFHYDSPGLGEGSVVTVRANSAAGAGPTVSTVVHMPADPCNAVAPTMP